MDIFVTSSMIRKAHSNAFGRRMIGFALIFAIMPPELVIYPWIATPTPRLRPADGVLEPSSRMMIRPLAEPIKNAVMGA